MGQPAHSNTGRINPSLCFGGIPDTTLIFSYVNSESDTATMRHSCKTDQLINVRFPSLEQFTQRYNGGKKPGREDGYSVGSPRVYEKLCLCRNHCVSSPLAPGDIRVLESECKLNVRIGRAYKPLFSATSFHQWYLNYSFPVLFLPVKIQFEVEGIEVKDK
jgi:hypothetical protein